MPRFTRTYSVSICCNSVVVGFACELCLEGFYGDALLGTTSDCQPCPCYEPGVSSMTCDITNGSVICDHCREGYIGHLCDQ